MIESLLNVDWAESGAEASAWTAAVDQARAARDAFVAEHAGGGHAFVDLAAGRDNPAIRAWCDAAPAHDTVLLAGIGGSALTARVFDALRETPDAPRLLVLDTVDPHAVSQAMRSDPQRTLLIGISKSGGTLETAAVFRTLESWMHASMGEEAAARIVVVCGEEENAFRAHAMAQGYATFPIPTGVGGRYSGLSAAGLLPAALGGVSIDALCAGAAWTWARASSDDPADNPALALTALHHHAHVASAGRPTAVLMPYGERLAPLAPWWAQLVGESLGKDGRGVEPVAARGPADQHSLQQLWLEGPDTRLVVTVGGLGAGPDVEVPDGDALACGHSLQTILDAECAATREALASSGRPVAHIAMHAPDAKSVGAFLMAYELAVVWLAKGMGVDPYGQPAVELGKKIAKRRLGG